MPIQLHAEWAAFLGTICYLQLPSCLADMVVPWQPDNELESSNAGAVAAFRGSSRTAHPTLRPACTESPGVGTYEQVSLSKTAQQASLLIA